MKILLKRNRQFIRVRSYVWIFVVFFMLCVPFTTFAGVPAPIEAVVTGLQQTYEKTQDFKANFIQTTTIQSIKKTDTEEGTVLFKNPKNMLWDYSKPKAKKLVINARKAWLYLPQEKAAYTQEADYLFKSKTLIKFLSGLGKLTDDFTIKYNEPHSLDKQGNYLLILSPLEKALSLNPFQITVDKDTFLILQISFTDTMGNYTALKFSNIFTNIGLSEKMFQFKPPKGVSIFNMP